MQVDEDTVWSLACWNAVALHFSPTTPTCLDHLRDGGMDLKAQPGMAGKAFHKRTLATLPLPFFFFHFPPFFIPPPSCHHHVVLL